MNSHYHKWCAVSHGILAIICFVTIAAGTKPSGLLMAFGILNAIISAVMVLALITEKEDAR